MIILLLSLLNVPTAFAGDPVMEACATAMDIAESNLRVVLNKPAHGQFSPEVTTDKAKLESAIRLIDLEQKSPGCMTGAYGKSSWAQYNGVRSLYDEFAKKYQFFSDPNPRAQTFAQIKDKENKCRLALKHVSSNLSSQLDVASESKLKNEVDNVVQALSQPNPNAAQAK